MGIQLAPYNNAMRLGQGFNSYTQQICLKNAVMQPSRTARPPTVIKVGETATNPPLGDGVGLNLGQITDSTLSNLPTPTIGARDESQRSGIDSSGRDVSQIVSYSSRFVDKLSDLTGNVYNARLIPNSF